MLSYAHLAKITIKKTNCTVKRTCACPNTQSKTFSRLSHTRICIPASVLLLRPSQIRKKKKKKKKSINFCMHTFFG